MRRPIERGVSPLDVIREEGAGRVAIGALLLSLAAVSFLLALFLHP